MSVSQNSLPDHALIQHLRQRLWEGGEVGNAAVLVGSGFSKNARPKTHYSNRFPDWSEISGYMFDGLYPPERVEDEERKERWGAYASSSGAARLAEEYARYLGRDALNRLLATSIPDNDHEPGDLHVDLLKLPWSEIFTTNYDTLLERARLRVPERPYHLISSISDIPMWPKPRIVKLHGSFPSQKPFIVTEEDFRTYPMQFAPFMNLVQQSAMENTLCLIGFSGEDPNFLAWSGWVRDHLGPSAPRIYLCGLLDLSPSQERMLHARNVTPIDLSQKFPRSKGGGGNRHVEGIRWLLDFLSSGKPQSIFDWLGHDV